MKRLRFFLKIFIALCTTIALAGVHYINEYDVAVFFNGSTLITDSPIVSIEGTLFVPLQNISQKLELKTTHIGRQNKFIVKRLADRKEIIFQLNSEKVIVNKEDDLMNYPLYQIKDRAYVSLPDFVWLFDYFLQKTSNNQYHIVSRINSITWQNQKLIINSKTPLNAKIDYYNNNYLVTVPNAIWSNQHQAPVIEVDDGVIKNINIKNLSHPNNDVLISLSTIQENPYIIFPEENSVIVSFLYQKPLTPAKPINKDFSSVTKTFPEISQKIEPRIDPQIEPKVKSTTAKFIFDERNILRQANCFVLKLPVEPDSVTTLESPKRLLLTFKNLTIDRGKSFSGKQYLPLIKDLSISKIDNTNTLMTILLGSNYKQFKQFSENIKLYCQSEIFHEEKLPQIVKKIEFPSEIISKVIIDKPIKHLPTENKISENRIQSNTLSQDTTPSISVSKAKIPEKLSQEVQGSQSNYQFKKELNGERIIIDPGHGGEDPGAISRNGLKEKDVVLQVAKLVAEKIKTAGAVPILLRKNDEYVSLQDRADLAIKEKGDLLVSLHFNSFYKQQISGSESYYYKPNDYKLAKNIHNQIIKIKKTKDNGIKQAQMYLLNHTHMPGVLLEPAYISNLKEEKLVQDPKFQQELSDAIVLGIINYLKDK